MTGWMNGRLDELDARLRELKREVARYENEVSWPQGRGLGRVHDVEALRHDLSHSTETARVVDTQRAGPLSSSSRPHNHFNHTSGVVRETFETSRPAISPPSC